MEYKLTKRPLNKCCGKLFTSVSAFPALLEYYTVNIVGDRGDTE